jgi:hypothetical protein
MAHCNQVVPPNLLDMSVQQKCPLQIFHIELQEVDPIQEYDESVSLNLEYMPYRRLNAQDQQAEL